VSILSPRRHATTAGLYYIWPSVWLSVCHKPVSTRRIEVALTWRLPYTSYTHTHTHTHTRPFNGPLSGTTRVSRYQKRKTSLDFTESKRQWVACGISWAICKSAPRSRQITTPAPHRSVFLQSGRPSCRPTNSTKAPKATLTHPTLSCKEIRVSPK